MPTEKDSKTEPTNVIDSDYELVRKEIVTDCNLIVVKVGTRVLTHPGGGIDQQHITQLANDLCDLVAKGRRVVLVSSGAVGAGMSQLKLANRPTDVAQLQAVAAIGQAHLINIYNETIKARGYHAAQVLLTADDLNDRARYLNVRNTLFSVMSLGAIPIINENDTVAVEELVATFGDNDRLAALVTNLLQARLLIILSDIEGLYDRHPDDPAATLVDTVMSIDECVMKFVSDRKNQLSRGGMSSKINAAKAVTNAGENVIIARGRRPHVLKDICDGKKIGTLFIAKGKSVTPRKRWISSSVQPRGKLFLDDGAIRAVREQGRSLLPIGITEVEGDFEKGDAVSLFDGAGREIARGLTNYDAAEIRLIQGRNSTEIEQLLKHAGYTEVVHRNNLALI
jgi:glutamate 5-kinase